MKLQAVNCGPLFGLVRCTSLQQRKQRGVTDVIILWRHSSLVSTSCMKWPIFCLFVAFFLEF